MSDNLAALSVSIREIPGVYAACVDYLPLPGQADMHDEIRACFERLQEWAKGLGLEPSKLLHIGIPVVRDGQLLKYECCVEAPDNIHAGPMDILMKDLPGGRYAVLTVQKDPAIIGDSIGRLYQDYLPQNHIELDEARPTYEIYYETTMEYCVPLVQDVAEVRADEPLLQESITGYAVELYLDDQLAAQVRDLRRALSENGISGRLDIPGERPHVSLAVFSSVDCDILIPLVRAYAPTLPRLDVELSAIGTFPTEGNVLFLVPVPGLPLLSAHQGFHRQLAEEHIVSSSYYLPGEWVPHCSVGLDIPSSQLARAVAICKSLFQPARGQFEELGVIADSRGVKSLGAWPLGMHDP